MQMKKLNLQQVLHLNEEAVFIQHKELGDWIDCAAGVFVLLDMCYLYLEKSDRWLDCDAYGEVWTAYKCDDELEKE